MFLIIVNGPSGCGKTTIVNLLKQSLSISKKVDVVSIDQFYYSLKPGEQRNWDHIDAIEMKLLIQKLEELKAGKAVWFPEYDYVTHQRIPDKYVIKETDILILEGIFALYDETIRNMADLKIYIDADPINTCFPRRYARDTSERGRSGQSVVNQYMTQVLQGYKEFVEPTKKYADMCYINEQETPTIDTPFIYMVCLYTLDKI